MADAEVNAGAGFESPVVARTRLVPPRLRAETVERPALVTRRLASPARLGVVSGPAGCGKSTLLAQFHAADPFPAWLSLGRPDNDPVVMWWSIIAALRTVIGGFGDSYRDRLLVAGPSVLDDIVASVANELDDRETPVHLFLDDLHLVDNPICQQSLHRLLLTMPPLIRVTVASRERSPLPLARFRLEGDLVEIDGTELALSRHEAADVLARLGATVEPARLDVLVDRTEGWPAGFCLAAIVLGGSDNAAGFVDDFIATDRNVAEYLVSEVLESLPSDVREFMVETSMLDRLNGGLCDAVSGRSDSAALLTRLEQSNAFVIALDREGVWYRYHHLFAELLEAELGRRRPDDVQCLHERAFAWLRNNGQIAAAIPHALAAGETDVAAELVSASWLALVNSGRLETLRRLLDMFEPEEIIGHQPLAITAAIAGGMGGHIRDARRYLEAAEHASFEGPPPDGTTTMTSSLALARASLALEGVDEALADGLAAYDLEPPGGIWRALAALDIGLALVMRGEYGEAIPYFEEVDQIGDPAMRTYALAELSLSQLHLGEADRAATTASTAIDLVAEAGIEDLIMAGVAYAAGALAAIALGDEATARLRLRQADRPMTYVGDALPMDSIHARLLLGRAAIALGEIDLARRHVDSSQQTADTIVDIGSMRTELTDLRAQADAADGGVSQDGEPEFTQRELEVIALLPSELTIREIGEELFLSRNTIKTYLRRVYGKLHASSREEAVLIADKAGLLAEHSLATRATTSPG